MNKLSDTATDSYLSHRNLFFSIIIFLMISIFSLSLGHASEIENSITQNIQSNSITVIGENHHRPESVQFFESIIDNLKNDNCLTVALEIASSQQSTIDQFVDGKVGVETIRIPSIIDHADYPFARKASSFMAGI